MLALVAALKPLVGKISELTREIAHRVHAHPDGQIFLSLFRDPKSVTCTASLCSPRSGTAEPATPPRRPSRPTRG